MSQIKITKRSVDAAESGDSDKFLWDTELKGFGLKVTPRGKKSYIVQYRMGGRGSRTRRYTIGAHGAPWTPDKARQRAQELLIDAKSGRDPAEIERAQWSANQELAFDHYVDRFIDLYAKKNQRRSWEQARNSLHYNAIPRLRSKALPSISRKEIATLLDEVARDRPATARYLHATLRKLFRWAVNRGDIQLSPMSEMPAPTPPTKRDRVLSDEELYLVWSSSHELTFPFGPMFRLLIATGQRREEVGAMRWNEVDLKKRVWTIPAERAKNGVAHNVPLNELAFQEVAELNDVRGAPARESNDLVFSTTGSTAPSGWSKAKARVDNQIEVLSGHPIAPWWIHDIRRTFATGLQRLGIRFEVTEALLNHVSGSKGGVAGVYQRHGWTEEKRSAISAWSKGLSRLISNQGEAIIPSDDANLTTFGKRIETRP